MEAIDLYRQLENPIDDAEIIKKLLVINRDSSPFYNGLTRANRKENPSGYYIVSDSDLFYSTLFNKWKKIILDVTRDEFIELYKKGTYGKDFITLRNFLKTVPDLHTKEEIYKLLYSKDNSKELKDAIENYSWTSVGFGSGWTHIKSRYINAKKEKRETIEHRLYLNVDTKDLYKMLNIMVEKYEKEKIPYYFKFDSAGSRDDTIVIYASSEHLMKNISILEEIKKENPELVSNFGKPPILTGNLDGWIGYGAEPPIDDKGNNHSFNEIRAELLESVFDRSTANWITKHRNSVILYNGKNITFEEYFINKIFERKMTYLQERYDDYFRWYGKRETKEELEKQIGYTKEELNSSQVRNNIYNIISNYVKNNFDNILSLGGNYEIEIPINNNKKTNIYPSEILNTIKGLAVQISNHDKTFIPQLQRNIKDRCKKYGIDENKFAFDVATRDKLLSVNNKTNTNETTQNKTQNNNNVIIKATTKVDNNQNNNQNNNKIPHVPAITKVDNNKDNNKQDELNNMINDVEYIPGTNIPKPRNRGVYETDEEYEKFLEEYYAQYFTEEQMSRGRK